MSDPSSEELCGVSHFRSHHTFLTECLLGLLRRTALFIEVSGSASIPREGRLAQGPSEGELEAAGRQGQREQQQRGGAGGSEAWG